MYANAISHCNYDIDIYAAFVKILTLCGGQVNLYVHFVLGAHAVTTCIMFTN